MRYGLTITENGGPAVAAKELRRIQKEANFEVVRQWHKLFLGEHFLPGAMKKYGYQPRKKGYMLRKSKQKHHQNPLVWSGRSQWAMRSAIKITGNSRTARGVMYPPKYFYMYLKGSPNKADEATRTTGAERQVLARVCHDYVTKALKGLREQRVTRVA